MQTLNSLDPMVQLPRGNEIFSCNSSRSTAHHLVLGLLGTTYLVSTPPTPELTLHRSVDRKYLNVELNPKL